jgi:hypothetical protein
MNKIEINKQCMESYPCKDRIKINKEDKGIWDAIVIKKWLIDHGHAVPKHFQDDYEMVILESGDDEL